MLILSLVGGCSLYSLGILTGRGGRVVLHNGHQTFEEGARGGGRRGEGGEKEGEDESHILQAKWRPPLGIITVRTFG